MGRGPALATERGVERLKLLTNARSERVETRARYDHSQGTNINLPVMNMQAFVRTSWSPIAAIPKSCRLGSTAVGRSCLASCACCLDVDRRFVRVVGSAVCVGLARPLPATGTRVPGPPTRHCLVRTSPCTSGFSANSPRSRNVVSTSHLRRTYLLVRPGPSPGRAPRRHHSRRSFGSLAPRSCIASAATADSRLGEGGLLRLLLTPLPPEPGETPPR